MKMKLAATIGIAVLIVCTILPADNETSSVSSREEAVKVLNAYAATQEKLQLISYRSNHESVTDYEGYEKSRRFSARKKRKDTDETLYWDNGKRARIQRSNWEYVGEKKQERTHSSAFFDGISLIFYNNNPKSTLGSGNKITAKDGFKAPPPKHRVIRYGSDGEFFGYCEDDYDRVDKLLLKAKNLSLKKDTNGYYVVNGKPECGEYTIWLDPAKDYQLIKSAFKKRGGDIFVSGNPLPNGCIINYEYVVDRFEQIQDVWIPVESHMSLYRKRDKQNWQQYDRKTIRSEIVLNPDFNNPPLFAPNDIKDGASFKKHDDKAEPAEWDNTEYTWQKGELVPLQ